MTKIISLRIDLDLLAKIMRLAKKEKRSLNNFITKTLSDFTEKKGEAK